MNNRLIQLWQVNKYLWMALAFALAYIPVAQGRGLLIVPLWAAWLLLLLGVINTGLRSYAGYREARSDAPPPRSRPLLSWIFTLIDIALISLAVGCTRGLQSDLWLLYFISMISESLYAPPKQTRLMAFSVAASYLLATVPLQIFLLHQPLREFGSVLASRLFFLITIGAYARRISYNATERNEELVLLREQMAAGEERGRIAREIHDGLGHAMVSIILRLELCARLIRPAPEEAESLLKEEIPTLRSAWNTGRDLAFHLRPWELDAVQENGLEFALRQHIGRFAERTGLIVELDYAADSSLTLRPEVAFALTRIVQEALTNVAKHAQATLCTVQVVREGQNAVRLMIQDNGRGFAAIGATGSGLQTMRERAEKQGGAFQLKSTPEDGTMIAVVLPL